MAINFPNSPSDGQQLTEGSVTYTYNATKGYWESIESSDGGGVTSYANKTAIDAVSSPSEGDLAYDTAADQLYIRTTTEWKRVSAGTDEGPIITTEPAPTHTLNNDGSTSTVTMVAEDPEGFEIIYGIAYPTPSNALPNQLATATSIDQSAGVFTFDPPSDLSNAGSVKVRLSASDGISSTTRFVTLTLPSPAYYGDRAVVFLGTVNTIDYFSISTAGSASDFGNQSASMFYRGACSNGERALAAGGLITGGSVGQATIDYYTIASPSNSTDFGDLTNARRSLGAASDGLRGVFGGGTSGDANSGITIDYVTIATTGNAIDFGDLTETRNGVGAAASDGTYALFAGKGTVIDRITIQTTGNASDFGDLLSSKERFGGLSDNSRAVWGGGSTTTNQMQYNTIATAGNSVDFGDLVNSVYGLSGTSDGTYGVFSGGANSSNVTTNVIQRIVVQTTGNASDFGDLSSANRYSSSTSGAAA
jgi:hypothetical protein